MKKIFLTFILITTAGFSHAKVERLQTLKHMAWVRVRGRRVGGRTIGLPRFLSKFQTKQLPTQDVSDPENPCKVTSKP